MTAERPRRGGRIGVSGFGDTPHGWATKRDIAVALGLGAGYLAGFAVPRRLDPWLARRLRGLFGLIEGDRPARAAAKLRAVLGPEADRVDSAQAVEDYYVARAELIVARVRGMHRRAWNPTFSFEGREHVRAALDERRGAILWRMNLGDTLMLQHAAWESGWPLVQLSAAGHGAKRSWVGHRLAAPLYARAENAYLAERVVIPGDWTSHGYLPRLVRALERNQVVGIRSEVLARQNVPVPLFESRLALPTGAPGLAHRTGAALIPVYTLREGSWRYRAVFGPPIEVDRSISRRAYTERAIEEFGVRLREAILRAPGDYQGWWPLRLPESADPETDRLDTLEAAEVAKVEADA